VSTLTENRVLNIMAEKAVARGGVCVYVCVCGREEEKVSEAGDVSRGVGDITYT
jgi:hypothetical protein